MSLPELEYGCADRPGDAAAYALGALEPREAQAFAAHLEDCVVCRDELLEFGHVLDALPLAADQRRPPRGLRRAVLREIGREGDRPARSPRWRPALAAGLAGLAALAIVAGTQEGSSPTHRIAAQVIGSPGSAELRLTGGHAELIVRHLRPPAPGHIYEVWLAPAQGAPRPTSALFSVTQAGSGDVEVPGRLNGVAKVMVTQEPAGGSLQPTSAPVIVARLD
jgi:hypothetical protein